MMKKMKPDRGKTAKEQEHVQVTATSVDNIDAYFLTTCFRKTLPQVIPNVYRKKFSYSQTTTAMVSS